MSELSKANPSSLPDDTIYRLDAGAANIRTLWRTAITTIACWRQRARERQMLARMGGAIGKDLGLSRADIWREVNKPFWRA